MHSDDYNIVGSINNKYKFIGNGVPVKMAESISNRVYNYLNLNLNTKDKSITIQVSAKQQNKNKLEDEPIKHIQLSLF